MNNSLKKDDKKTIRAWAMYDWANSVYMLVITSAIFPAYYNEVTKAAYGSSKVDVLGIHIENTAIYSICLGISFGIVALISPMLSSIADSFGRHKSFMRNFCLLGAVACAALFMFDGSNILLGLGALMLATIGYSGSIVFYNSYLPAIASEENQDKVSARGYAYGYLGATTLLIINLGLILNQKALGVTDDTLLPRISFLSTGIWWFGFAQIPFRKLPKGIGLAVRPQGSVITAGYAELRKVFGKIRKEPVLRTFLVAFFFSIMGVQTVMFMAASFGEKEIHLTMSQLIFTVLVLEYIGIAGAFLFAWISKKTGNLNGLMIAVIIWIFICIGSYFIHAPVHFYIAAFFIGLVMGGIQSLARSTYAKLIPKTGNNAGYFSFYDVCEKLAMMLGLIMFGYLDHLTGSMRNSIFALVLWFTLGLVAILWLRRIMKAGNAEADGMKAE